jgi:hypothetical protein
MAVGVVSRESVRQALQNGITAAQIINYLELHAHPQMRKRYGYSFTPAPNSSLQNPGAAGDRL